MQAGLSPKLPLNGVRGARFDVRGALAWAKERARQVARWSEKPGAKRALYGFQWVLLAAISGFLILRLRELGWREIISSLPQSPYFYLFFAIRFFTLPLTEYAVYSKVWGRGAPVAVQPFSFFKTFPAFVRKRAYNFVVFGYSGEAFLAIFAQRHLGLSARQALSSVKDVNILAALTANIAALILISLALSILYGGGFLPGRANEIAPALSGSVLPGILLAGAAMAGGAIVVVGFLGRRWINLDAPQVSHILVWNILRQIVQVLAFAGMYKSALPMISLPICLIFAALQLALSRIPFLPNQDLVYLGAALAIAGAVSGPSIGGAAAISQIDLASVLVADAGISQLLSIAMFFITAGLARPVRTAPSRGEKSNLE